MQMESDDGDFEAPTKLSLPKPDQQPKVQNGVRVRGKGREWKKVKTCASEDEVREWLTQDTGQWVKSKHRKTAEGVKQYMVCKHPGCSAELVAWYHSEDIKVSMLLHGNHLHGKEEWKTRGLSATTKKVSFFYCLLT